jgi:IS5 family transposase
VQISGTSSDRWGLGRWYLKGAAGDAANVILSTVGNNLRLVIARLRLLFTYY